MILMISSGNKRQLFPPYLDWEKDGSYFLDAGSSLLPLSDEASKIVKEDATGSELILGVRPEDTLLGSRRTARQFIKAEIYVTEPMTPRLEMRLSGVGAAGPRGQHRREGLDGVQRGQDSHLRQRPPRRQ